MFFTAFIWGAGVSCGACSGLLLFCVLKSGLDYLTKTEAYRAMEEFNKRTLELMQNRNEISEEQKRYVSAIAESCANLAEWESRKAN